MGQCMHEKLKGGHTRDSCNYMAHVEQQTKQIQRVQVKCSKSLKTLIIERRKKKEESLKRI